MPSPALAGILQALGAGFGGYAQDQQARQERDRAKLLDSQSAQRLGLDTERLGMDRQTHTASMDDVKAKLAERQAATARGTAGEQTINDNWGAAIGGDKMAQAKIIAYRPDLAGEFTKAPPAAEALLPTMQGGKPVYTPRSRAAGMEAPAPAGPQASFTPVTVGEGGNQVVKPFNTRTGETGASIGDAKLAGGGMGHAGIKMKLAKNQEAFSVIDDALKELDAYPDAVGMTRALPFIGDRLDQRIDPKGIPARTSIGNIGSLVMHDRSGAAVTVHEMPRLAPFIPQAHDTPEKIRINLQKLRAAMQEETNALHAQMGVPTSAPGSIGLGGKQVSPEDAAHAKRDPQFAAWLKSQGYAVP